MNVNENDDSAFPIPVAVPVLPSAPSVNSSGQYVHEPTTLLSSSQEEEDFALAMRLQAEEDNAIASSSLMRTMETDDYHSQQNATLELESVDDAEYARKLQQVLDDQNLARRSQEDEINHLAASRIVEPPRRCCTTRRILYSFFTIAILGAGAVSIVLFGPELWNRVRGEDYFDYDNSDNQSSKKFSSWKNKGKGLKLEIVNALTDDWYSYLATAIKDWNKSGALALTATVASKNDKNCQHSRGVLKVCNDYFGMNGWTGLNEIYFEGSHIISSVAKMNESYLNGGSTAEKQYVMCHELGHGCGLPHRDENTNNKDLGTCLDYTVRPQNNMHPDEVDYENLINLYGLIESKRNLRADYNKRIDDTHIFRHLQYGDGDLIFQNDYAEVYETRIDETYRVVTSVILAR